MIVNLSIFINKLVHRLYEFFGVIIMQITIDKSDKIPIYLQVKNQIMDLIKRGALKVGTKMPTERELSENLGISRNTISSAYKSLEQDGVLKSYQGRGTFVAGEAEPWMKQSVEDKIVKLIDLSFEEALETGIKVEEFLSLVDHRVKEKVKMIGTIVGIYVECNIEQAKMFSNQLCQITNMNIIPLTISELENMDKETKEIVEKSQIVVTTFNHVNEVNDIIKGFKKEVLGVAINADLQTIVKIARYPSNTKFGFICISNEFMFKVKGALEKAGLNNINIEFSNCTDKNEIKNIIDKSDVMIVSPGRYRDVRELCTNNMDIIEFLYSLDDGSVKALKSKIVELQYYK